MKPSGSHWRIVLLLLDEAVAVAAGQALRVRTTAELAGALPRYTFEVHIEDEQGQLRQLAPARITYPEDAFNCNEAADFAQDFVQ